MHPHTINNPPIDQLTDQFISARSMQPNIADCWISYLALKKRHYGHFASPSLAAHCAQVLHNLSAGHCDFTRDDLLRLTIYKISMNDDIKT